MQQWWHQMQMQVQVKMWNNAELSRTSLVLGAQDGVEIENQHEKHVDTLPHLHYTLHINMIHLHTYVHTCSRICTLAKHLHTHTLLHTTTWQVCR